MKDLLHKLLNRRDDVQGELIPITRLPDLIPSSRRGRKLSMPTVYNWMNRGKLRTRKIGGSRYVLGEDLADFLQGDAVPASPLAGPGRTTAAKEAGDELDQILSRKGGRQ